MASVSVSHLVIFIASLVVAASVAGVFTSEVGRITSAIDDQSRDASEQIRTDIEIISDAGSDVYDAGTDNVSVLVKNVGSRDIPADSDVVDVLFDGTYQTDVNVTVVGGSGPDWEPEGVVKLEFSVGTLAGGTDHRVKVVVSGDEEVFEFRV